MTRSDSIENKILYSYPDDSLELKWRELLVDADFPVGLVMPEYLQDFDRTGGSRFAVLAITDDEVVGVLTGIKERDRIVAGLSMRPQVCCRLSADKDQVALALAEGVGVVGGDAGLITLHTWSPMPGFEQAGYRMRPCSGEEGLIVLDLAEGPDRVFAGFSQTRRNEIRKAIKLGVEVSEPATEAERKEYYRIHVGWCRRKGMVPASFDAVTQSFERPELQRLFLAKLEGRVLAGSVFRSCPGGIVEYVANFSDSESLPYKPNGLLVWRAIEWAYRDGHTLFSLGAAHSFLQRFGGRNFTTYRYRLDRTLLRRHSIQEALLRLRTQVAHLLPAPARKAIKRLLGRT